MTNPILTCSVVRRPPSTRDPMIHAAWLAVACSALLMVAMGIGGKLALSIAGPVVAPVREPAPGTCPSGEAMVHLDRDGGFSCAYAGPLRVVATPTAGETDDIQPSGDLSIMVSGTETMRCTATKCTFNVPVDFKTAPVTSTIPTLIPNRADYGMRERERGDGTISTIPRETSASAEIVGNSPATATSPRGIRP